MNKLWGLLGPLVLAGIATAVPAFAEGDLQAVSATTTHLQNGAQVPYTPHVGDKYTLTLKYKLTGGPFNTFRVRFLMADQTADRFVVYPLPGDGSVSVQFDAPLDGTIKYQVIMDPFHESWETYRSPGSVNNNSIVGSFTPIPPEQGIEYYAPRTLNGQQSMELDFVPGFGTLDRVAIMMGKPSTESSQTLKSSNCVVMNGIGFDPVASFWSNPAAIPVYLWDRSNLPVKGTIYAQHNFQVEERNTRANADVLRNVTWSQLDALAGISVFKFYQSPETVVQSTSAEVNQFVKSVLGQNYRAVYTPYDAARALFQAVVARIEYLYPSPSTSAVEAYTKKKGDCASFSKLYVAALRNIGFPARTASGWLEGQDIAHVWSECYFPGSGWFVSDATYCDSFSPNGAYAYWFGNMPDLNTRVSMTRSDTHSLNGLTASGMQAPEAWFWGTAKLGGSQLHTSIVAK